MTYDKSLIDDLSHGIYAKCVCKSDIKVKTILVGFPGMGLAGSIAAQHISEELDLDTIGFVEGLAIPPVAVFLDGYLRHPYRIMGKEGLDMVVFIGESAVSAEGAYHIANAVMDWATKHGAVEIIILDGFPYLDPADESNVYLVSEPEIKEKALKLKIPPLKSGYIKGFAGAMLNKTMTTKIDGLAFLVGTRPDLPDPGSAATLIETVNNYKGIKVNTETLVKQQESIKRKLQELSIETQEMASATPTETKKKRTFYT
ncbi:MAG: proteasome assembly chaperone family protein [Candidatus Heimdallarchaeota archaeon]|nr:proteasome assembly chaperone family protein [Candidatus Heimdallarchaeota archaeon]